MSRREEGQYGWGKEDEGEVMGAGIGEARIIDPGITLHLEGYLVMGLLWASLHVKMFPLVLCRRRRVRKVRPAEEAQQWDGGN